MEDVNVILKRIEEIMEESRKEEERVLKEWEEKIMEICVLLVD